MRPELTLEETYSPQGLNSEEATRILRDTDGEAELSKRLELISERFLGRPYVEGPLGGGAELPELFRVNLDAFDCVTYMETVLALALSAGVNEFIDTIRQIRYQGAKIDWLNRNHYMVDWARNNEKNGFIANLTVGPATVEKTCTLGIIIGLPEKTATFRHFPRRSLPRVGGLVETGDLILFVSTRKTLDVFHTGLLVKREGRLLLRHATQTAGAVIEQDLAEFVTRNRMAGFILLRPLCQR